MTLNKKKLKKYKKLKKIIERWTRAEVMSRIGDCKGMAFGDYYTESLKCRDEIRRLLYGTDDLIMLGKKFNLPLIKVKNNGK